MKIVLYGFFILLISFSGCTENKDKTISLVEKEWRFNKGDNLQWKAPEYNDDYWDIILPTKRWQKQGYEEEIPYAWYRVKFKLPIEWKNKADIDDLLQLYIGKIDDTDQTFLNGKRIGQNAELVPVEESDVLSPFEGDIAAYNYVRCYQLPVNDRRILWGEINILAVRVHNHLSGGGIYSRNPHIRVVPSDQKIAHIAGKEEMGKNTIDIGGFWKFKPGDNMHWKSPELDHSNWDSITVGATWSWYGYDFDGYAWYRKEFVLPSSLKRNSLFHEHIKLVIGAIQDYGTLYLNEANIEKYRKETSQNKDYPAHWGYPLHYEFDINNPLFRWDETNILAVRVYNINKQGDELKAGGMKGKPYLLKVADFKDYISIIRSDPLPVEVIQDNPVEIPFEIKNLSSKRDVSVRLNIVINEMQDNETVFNESKELTIHAGGLKEEKYYFSPKQGNDYQLSYSLILKDNDKTIKNTQILAYSPKAQEQGKQTPELKTDLFIEPVMIPVSPGNQHIEGFLGKRMEVNIQEGLYNMNMESLLKGYYEGSAQGSPEGEFVHKYVQAMIYSAAVTKDTVLDKGISKIIEIIIASQEKDGYLGTYNDEDRWTDWDVWVHKHVLIGLISYYKATGFTPALEAAKRLADLLNTVFGNKPGQIDLITMGPHAGMASSSILDPMTELYMYTGDDKYLGFCHYLVDAIEQPHGPRIISTLEKTGRVDKVGNAKAYEMLSNIIGMLKLYQITGEERLKNVAEIAWEDIVKNRLYITGTSSTSEVFQGNHDLPGEEEVHPGEGCVSAFWLYFNRQLFYLTGDHKYVDQIEKTLYNHLLAAHHPVTSGVCYFTPLQGHKKYVENHAVCCNASITRSISKIPCVLWAKYRDNGLAVLIYNRGEFSDVIRTRGGQNKRIHLKMETDYPRNGEVRIILNNVEPLSYRVALSVPQWCTQYRVKHGSDISEGKAGRFLVLDKRWQKNDTIHITMDMRNQALQDKYNYQGHIALKHGPMVLAVDKYLNPRVKELENLFYYHHHSGNILLDDYALPDSWVGDVAFKTKMITDGTGIPVILTPFADAGQKGSGYRIWIRTKP